MKAPIYKPNAAQKRAMLDEIKREKVEAVKACETDRDTAWWIACRAGYVKNFQLIAHLYKQRLKMEKE